MRTLRDGLLTPPELSEHLGVPVATLSQWRYLGKGPAFMRVGKHIRYRSEAVEAWLVEHTVDVAS